jgi:radical SAM-linked protein
VTHESPSKQRLHITFGKSGALQYTGNLDVAKIWERVLRRADLPILYTKGFNTRPRIQLATALPLGITSECEILDVSLREAIALDGLIARLLAVSPRGLEIYKIEEAPIDAPALQTQVRSAEYRIHFVDPIDRVQLQAQIETILSASEWLMTKERKGKAVQVDIRSLVHELYLDKSGDLIAHISVGDQGNLRPDELLESLGLAETYHRVHRFRLHRAVEP